MPGPINGNGSNLPAVYTNPIRNNAWRQEMLSQALDKVKQFSEQNQPMRITAPKGPPPKGSMLDVYA